ncbi:MAG: SMC family ATPase [Methanocellales archaeon]|nr:SMC family ATPase [Methanocellales archaeon]MDD3291208.1 SMC family ATPase [Methanocellales archaeon]MDD5235308.1 SMC family ATPase [Methanocellales archaeon]MDD5484536.1 SMC family ATPase [Methanocellales archaeon]
MKTLDSFFKELEETTSGGFVIEGIELKGFMRYLDKSSVHFPHKFNVIMGKTGTGKTSLLDAVTFALYKRTSRTDLPNVKIQDICKPGGYIKITFSHGESRIPNRYEVIRGLTSSGTSYVTLKRDGLPIGGTIPEIDAKIQEIIGLDYVGFHNSTFVRQEEMKELGAETGSQRLEIFQKLFRLEIFEKAQSLATEELGLIALDIKEKEAELKVRKDQLTKLPEMQEELDSINKDIKTDEDGLRGLDEIIAERELLCKELRGKHEKFFEIKARESEASNDILELNKKIKKACEDHQNTREIREKVLRLDEETRDYESLRASWDTLREREQKIKSLEGQKSIYEGQKRQAEEEHKSDMARLSSHLSIQEERLGKIVTDVDGKEAFLLLKREGALEERIERIKLEMEWLRDRESLISSLKTERDEAHGELDEVSARTKRISAESFVLSEIQEQMDRIKSDKERKQEEWSLKSKKIEKEIEEILAQMKSLAFSETELGQLSEMRRALEAKKQKREMLEQKRRELDRMGDVSKLIENLKAQKAQKELIQRELQASLKVLSVDKTRYESIELELKEMERKRSELKGDIREKKGKADQIKRNVEDLLRLREQIKELEEKLRDLQETSEVLTLLKDKIFHKRGIVMYAINQLLPQLAKESSANLSDLTDARFSKVQLTPYEESKGYGIRIDVEGPDGLFHDVQEFSGGERTQINAALRFAIAKELASLPQVGRTFGRMKTLFIDEGDLGSLDTEVSRELFVKKLFDMGQFFDKIILITHLTEVADKFPGKIRVYMTPDERSRIEVAT